MNKNHENYKATYSQFHPSDEVVERVMNITNEKKHGFNISFKRLAAATLAFAILIGGGFGTNYMLQKSDSGSELSVLVAYASTGDYLYVGSENAQELIYAMYLAPSDDKEAVSEAKTRFDNDYAEAQLRAKPLVEDGYSASWGRGFYPCYNDAGEETAGFFFFQAGSFALSLDDYSNVESFKVENSSQYGEITFSYFGQFEEEWAALPDYYFSEDFVADEYVMSILPSNNGHEFKATGDELRRSQEEKFYVGGTKHEVNKGYFLEWYPTEELTKAIGNNPSFDLSQITDTITFTVEFTDGEVKTASLNLYFDSDGYMHFGE